MAGKRVDRTGQRSGMLVAVSYVEQKNETKWLFRCDCGNEVVMTSAAVFRKRGYCNRSCGCSKGLIISGTKRQPNAGIKRYYSAFKSHSKQRSIDVTLSFDDYVDITERDCHYCGKAPPDKSDVLMARYTRRSGVHAKQEHFSVKIHGLDRKDSDLGYTPENSVSCCKECNYAKQSRSVSDFLNHMERIHNFQKKLKDVI